MSDDIWDEISSSNSLEDTCREMLHSLAECQRPEDFLVCMARAFGLLGDSNLSNKGQYYNTTVDAKASGKDVFVALRHCMEQLQQDQKDIGCWVRTWWYSNYFDEFTSILLNGGYVCKKVRVACAIVFENVSPLCCRRCTKGGGWQKGNVHGFASRSILLV